MTIFGAVADKLIFMLPMLLIAVILHEIAHGLVAERLGDPTARSLGRINLNPIVHIDPFMTVILPVLLLLAGSPVLLGGAKPVPIDPRYFKDPRRGMLWVALAGPLTNFALATIFYGVIRVLQTLVSDEPSIVSLMLVNWALHGIVINVVLGVFNLIPIPPLDGGRIAVGLLPLKAAYKLQRLERYGILIVIMLLYFGLLNPILEPFLNFVFNLL